MSLTCALSNEVPEVAVVSPLSGTVFEKRLILKYIEEHGTDPINGDKLSEDMLIEIKTPAIVKPRPPSATSIPAILKSLQDEWDAVMLHSFTLRQQLQTARQELSHALYQHDAACRVIARLTKEVTAAREALATLKPKTGGGAGTGGGQVGSTQLSDASGPDQNAEEQQISPDVLEKLDNKARVLTADRKRRGKTVPEDLVKLEQLKNFKTLASHSGLHSVSIPGILAVDICPTDKNKILTGGNDKNAIIFNKDNEQVITQLKGHTKKVTSVIYHPNQENAITASPDGQIRIWHLPTAQTIQLVRAHDGPVTGVSLHATGDYILSTSTDEFWAFSDLQTGRILTKAGEPSIPHALTTAQFHPDGLIFGTGTSDSQIKIWDLKERLNVANFPGHSGSISAMSFSENGFYLATAADDSCVKLWDLRKLKNFKTIYLNDNYQVKDLCFDQSGTYLGVAGTDVRVYISKQWENICTFTDHTATATGVRFGDNGSFLVSVSLDRALKVYGLQQ